MATYKSPVTGIAAPAEKVFTRLSNLEGLKSLIANVPADQIPADQAAMLEQINATSDSITFPGGPVGTVTLRKVKEEAPSYIRLEGEGTPVPMSLELNITPLTPETCEAQVVIDVQIPMMLKPMVNGPLQKMADQFAIMLRQLRFN